MKIPITHEPPVPSDPADEYPAELFRRAEEFNSQRSFDGLEVITPEDLMLRLKVNKGWIAEKRRPRCIHPLPAITNRPLRFSWRAIVAWLKEEACRDAERLQHRRALPVRHRKPSQKAKKARKV